MMATVAKNVFVEGNKANANVAKALDIGQNVVVPIITALTAAFAAGKGINRIFFGHK